MSGLPNFLDPRQPYEAAATVEDIYYCFRLLLGRNPSASEWPGHSCSDAQ